MRVRGIYLVESADHIITTQLAEGMHQKRELVEGRHQKRARDQNRETLSPQKKGERGEKKWCKCGCGKTGSGGRKTYDICEVVLIAIGSRPRIMPANV